MRIKYKGKNVWMDMFMVFLVGYLVSFTTLIMIGIETHNKTIEIIGLYMFIGFVVCTIGGTILFYIIHWIKDKFEVVK